MRVTRNHTLRGWTMCLVALAAFACGGNDAGKKGGDEPEGEPCASPGANETGCVCSAEQPPGSRHCRPEGIWSACTCPPARTGDCMEGERLRCGATCPGESEARIVLCLQGGTFDCSCDGDSQMDGGGRRPSRDGGR